MRRFAVSFLEIAAHCAILIVCIAGSGPLFAEEDLEALWRTACLWEVGSNQELVPATRRRLIEMGEPVLDFLLLSKLDTADGLAIRALQVVVPGLATAQDGKLRGKLVERLRAGLAATQANVRRNAAELLGAIGAAEAVPDLARLLADPEARMGALRALAALKADSATAEVVALVGSSAPERQRVEAIAALGTFAGAAAEHALLDALAAESAPVRFAAQYALERRKAVAALIGRLPTGPVRVRLHVIEALGRIGDAEARPHLLALIEDADPIVRGFAAGALLAVVLPADHDRLVERLRAESHAFAREKLAALVAKIDAGGPPGK